LQTDLVLAQKDARGKFGERPTTFRRFCQLNISLTKPQSIRRILAIGSQ